MEESADPNDPNKIILKETLWQVLLLVTSCGTLWGVLGLQCEAFVLLLLGGAAWIGGVVLGSIRLPPLTGMLLVGILFRNLPVVSEYNVCISVQWSSIFREASLVVILLRAGLGLDPNVLRALKSSVLRLAFVPCLSEAVVAAFAAKFILPMPWSWAFALGFCVCAASAAVLVPGMLRAEERGLGHSSGACTLVLAALSLDNVLALTGFTISYGIIISVTDDIVITLVLRLMEPVVGFVLGSTIGAVLWYIPSFSPGKACSLLWIAGWAMTSVSRNLDFSGAGAIGCVSLAFVASLRWRQDLKNFKDICSATGSLWTLLEPFLFVLIGAAVDLPAIFNKNLVFVLLVLLIGLLGRAVVTYFVLLPTSALTFSEKLFVAFSWLSKATVQAAVGSQLLDYAKSHNLGGEFMRHGEEILTVSVLCIILTAPLGAIFMELMSPRLLRSTSEESFSVKDSSECSGDVKPLKLDTATSDYGSLMHHTI